MSPRDLCVGNNYTWITFTGYTVVSHVVISLIHWPSLFPLIVGDLLLILFARKSGSFLSTPFALEAFMLGSVPAVILAIGAEYVTLASVLTGLDIANENLGISILSSFLLAFVMAAMIEEVCKFAMMKVGSTVVCRQSSSDGFGIGQFKTIVLFSGIGALGFSTMENVKYVMVNTQANAVFLTLMRVVFATSLHVGTGIYIGLSGAKSALVDAHRSSLGPDTIMQWDENWVHALTLPIVVHGLYDFLSFLTSALISHDVKDGSSSFNLFDLVPTGLVLFVVSPVFYRFIRSKYSLVTDEALLLLSQIEAGGDVNDDEYQPINPTPAPIDLDE
eukprot:TRINITY_DN21729_c0_g1_i1.p1 TRINITY_DN21729_c0_g1~~TRINITY_DN21729_c0_g1_i1.p1  ORF type:complete len:332 (-),score=73.81 TRINITY_DN21729_c0_g1_i1:21-1016(-)